MKIFNKLLQLPEPDVFGSIEITIAKIYLHNIPTGNNLLMQTIDYYGCIELVDASNSTDREVSAEEQNTSPQDSIINWELHQELLRRKGKPLQVNLNKHLFDSFNLKDGSKGLT